MYCQYVLDKQLSRMLLMASAVFLYVNLFATCVGAIEASAVTAQKVPDKGQGIWVTAICDRGQDKDTDISVCLLTAEEYVHHQVEEKGYMIGPSITAPVLFRDVKPGDYYVGIELLIDTDIIKPQGVAPDHRPRPEEFFADDLPASWQVGVTTRPWEQKVIFHICMRKWYRVSVEKGTISRVVSLFLDRNGSLLEWEKCYPATDQFQISNAEDSKEEFWRQVGSMGTKISPQQIENMTKLLSRGGRICLPQVSNPIVISINDQGYLKLDGAFTDKRDGAKYRMLAIGSQIWMAENLRFMTGGSLYLGDNRFYTYDAATRACPEGWHLPDHEEWRALIRHLGGESFAINALQQGGSSGFGLLFAGIYDSGNGIFLGNGQVEIFWSSLRTDDSSKAFSVYMVDGTDISYHLNPVSNYLSVRCIKDY